MGSYKEIWIELENGQAMCALINNNRGWLMCIMNEEGNSLSSRNPDYIGDEETTLDFMRNNGQCDYYPLSWCLSVDIVYHVLNYFEQEKKLPEFIVWHEDTIQ